jgi:hypothetical protein
MANLNQEKRFYSTRKTFELEKDPANRRTISVVSVKQRRKTFRRTHQLASMISRLFCHCSNQLKGRYPRIIPEYAPGLVLKATSIGGDVYGPIT